jgi:hypothetical protein
LHPLITDNYKEPLLKDVSIAKFLYNFLATEKKSINAFAPTYFLVFFHLSSQSNDSKIKIQKLKSRRLVSAFVIYFIYKRETRDREKKLKKEEIKAEI